MEPDWPLLKSVLYVLRDQELSPAPEFLFQREKQYFLFRAVPKVQSLPQASSMSGMVGYPLTEEISGPAKDLQNVLHRHPHHTPQ